MFVSRGRYSGCRVGIGRFCIHTRDSIGTGRVDDVVSWVVGKPCLAAELIREGTIVKQADAAESALPRLMPCASTRWMTLA